MSKMMSPQPVMPDTIAGNLLSLAGFEVVAKKSIGKRTRLRARRASRVAEPLSCSVIVPCRNEIDNVDSLIARLPSVGMHTELIWVDGDSTDGTQSRIERAIAAHPEVDMRLLHQRAGGGKAAAVFQGFDAASGDVLIILDADMAVAPEDLSRFYLALAEGVCEFANGTRFAYPMQAGAMPPLNYLGNRAFGAFFSRLLNTTITDTLCGTKALFRRDWPAIRDARPLFGGHDPWGDFDLLLGAALTRRRILDIPVRYYARTAGESKMQPLHHGAALAGTCLAGVRRLGPLRLITGR